MKIERREIPISDVEVRTTEGQNTVISGYAARFDKLSVPLWGFREQIRKGAFENSVRNNNVKALWNHNSDIPLGSTKNGTLKLQEDDQGLRFELELPESNWGQFAAEAIRRGDVEGVSFGFQVKKDEWDKSDPKNVIRTLVEVDLIEISPTPFPAYPQTSVGVRSLQEVFEENVKIPPETPQRSLEVLKKRIDLAEKAV
ncbi:HK97 family phage prohead protease [Effusibacillus dendaii]|uniref:Head maturation protease of prophage CP-933C n=1 Tax=Effusibacillus dendaii TaxID=2743772 RepID=A0A7I8DBV8_9BACL|nr:HK97 family phage prohead protease [Effusibacillus dendaii]BCJ86459.1 head maturation protease of prophage CP-933C [Effusibacillus dendaii]